MTDLKEQLLNAALRYAELGYPVFPCVSGGKAPLTKRGFKDASTDPERIEAWWTRHPNANIGIPMDGMLAVDVDGGENPWLSNDPEKMTDLARGPLSLTPRGGRHHLFRQPADRKWSNTAGKIAPKVDTRANGGYIVVPPSAVGGKPYAWAEGNELDGPPGALPEPPVWLSELLDNGRTRAVREYRIVQTSGDVEVRALAYLDAMPPAVSGLGGHNATYAAATALVHGFGIPPDRALELILSQYNPRCEPPWTEKELRHKVEDAATKSHDFPFGWLRDQEGPDIELGVDLSAFLSEAAPREDETPREPSGPDEMPEELLRVPGFVSEVMDHCLEISPYPNTVMAFCGALALQAFLAGRKVRDPGDNRTNIYLLALAHSSAGKDHPRKLNMQIAHQIGLADSVGGGYASGEGIQDALFLTPCMLFQTDEINSILLQINKARDARHEAIMSTLLMLYSTSNSVFPMRRKAGKESPGVIDQPCLSLFGTAIPKHYYEALSERMLTNGFFARMSVLESKPRQQGQEPRILELPPRIVATAKWWADYRPGTGNLENWHPVPAIVAHSDEAKRLLVETRLEAEAEYTEAEKAGDSVGTTVWGRVSEQMRKLALLYAISENHLAPRISLAAVQWASIFVMRQTRRMLFMAAAHVADNPFHAECLKLLEKLRGAPNGELPHSVLLKRMKMDAKTFSVLIETLAQQGDIEVVAVSTVGRAGRTYRFAGDKK